MRINQILLASFVFATICLTGCKTPEEIATDQCRVFLDPPDSAGFNACFDRAYARVQAENRAMANALNGMADDSRARAAAAAQAARTTHTRCYTVGNEVNCDTQQY